MDTKIIIVDDDKLVRQGFVSLLSQKSAIESNIKVVGNVSNGEELYEILDSSISVDVIILDMKIYGITDAGYEILLKINTDYILKKAKVLILSAEINDPDLINKSIKNGACGFLAKDIDLEEFIQSIKKVMDGKKYIISDRISKTLYEKEQDVINLYDNDLTDREIEIFKLFAAGFTRSEIPKKIFTSGINVDKYKGKIKDKTGLSKPIDFLWWILKNKKELMPEILDLHSEKLPK